MNLWTGEVDFHSGSLRRVDIGTNSGSVRVSLDIAPDNGIATSTWEVGSAEITEALVLYCGAHNVPLPAAGAKSLQRFGDSLLLIVALNARVKLVSAKGSREVPVAKFFVVPKDEF